MMSFFAGFEKRAEAMKEVATVALIDVTNRTMLMGRRRDNGKWTPPGGHLEKGEDMYEGAARELQEEAGVEVGADDLVHLKSQVIKGQDGVTRKIHAFKAFTVGRPEVTNKNDPDKEFTRMLWVKMKGGLPKYIKSNLHVPFNRNILLQNLNFTRGGELLPGRLLKWRPRAN